MLQRLGAPVPPPTPLQRHCSGMGWVATHSETFAVPQNPGIKFSLVQSREQLKVLFVPCLLSWRGSVGQALSLRAHMALGAMWISPAATEGCVPAVGGFKSTAARQSCCPVVFGGCRLPGSRQEPQQCKVLVRKRKQYKNYT